jgi:hypothetical protein
MTLKTLWLNPSGIQAYICFQKPPEAHKSSEAGWQVDAGTIKTDTGQEFFAEGGGAILEGDENYSIKDSEICSSASFGMPGSNPLPYDGRATKLTLSIPNLTLPGSYEIFPEDIVRKANERLASKGIAFDVVHGDHENNFNILKRPEGMADLEIYPLIWEALSEQYAGPWEFTVEVKP